jgi:hypothetical protein
MDCEFSLHVLHPDPTFIFSKYIITTQIYEKLGQGGRLVALLLNLILLFTLVISCRADLTCHWEDTDTVAQAMFDNVSDAPLPLPTILNGSTGYPHLLLHRLCCEDILIESLDQNQLRWILTVESAPCA